MPSQITAFFRGKQIATGQRDEVALSLREQLSEYDGSVLIFDDLSGRVVDLDYRKTETRSAGRVARFRMKRSHPRRTQFTSVGSIRGLALSMTGWSITDRGAQKLDSTEWEASG